jgi:aspartate aminotransferase
VLLTDPVYPYYAGRANFLDAETTFVPVDDDGHLDPTTVEAHTSDDTAVIVVNTPNNPMGVTYDAETMTALVEVAETHDALLVADEVYDHFDHSGRFASALATQSAHRLVTNAFSKSLAITGWRVGYAVFPPEGEEDAASTRAADLFDDATTRHMLSMVTGSRPAQAAVHQALTETGPDYFQRARNRVKARVDTLTDALDDAGAAYTEPEGAFYVMADLPAVPGTFAGVERLIDEAGVAGMPGEAFGEARADWVRFSVTTDRVETAGDRLRSYLG